MSAQPWNEDDPTWGGPNPSLCDDITWWRATGMCGGCGEEGCHEGPCGETACLDLWDGHIKSVCTQCPTRTATGEVTR